MTDGPRSPAVIVSEAADDVSSLLHGASALCAGGALSQAHFGTMAAAIRERLDRAVEDVHAAERPVPIREEFPGITEP